LFFSLSQEATQQDAGREDGEARDRRQVADLGFEQVRQFFKLVLDVFLGLRFLPGGAEDGPGSDNSAAGSVAAPSFAARSAATSARSFSSSSDVSLLLMTQASADVIDT